MLATLLGTTVYFTVEDKNGDETDWRSYSSYLRTTNSTDPNYSDIPSGSNGILPGHC